MVKNDNERIRKAVRTRYGKIARESGQSQESLPMSSCCDFTAIPSGKKAAFNCCVPSGGAVENFKETSCCAPVDFPINKMAQVLGYTEGDLKSDIGEVNMGLGCGNPVALASLKRGETVVSHTTGS